MRRIAFALSLTMALAVPAQSSSTKAKIDELRHSFTLDHKSIPPEVLGDLGDSNLADSSSIRVTIDLIAAMGSNLYADEIKTTPTGWVSQRKVVLSVPENLIEELSYEFNGVTSNGILVVTAVYSGGGSGSFFTLNLLDAAAGRGFDSEGKPYDRLNLTIIRSIMLGDRWDGEIKINGDTISIITARQDFTHGPRRPGAQVLKAMRP
ncbi:MAG: hypothetical protein E7774_00430 [Bradyrhizobium sp.]|nr:MAG: hypothetical protein E7774_00430 [Bradyrhizobium sp.]